MKNDSNPIIRSQEVTIDMHICAALSESRGSGEIYFAAIAPDMELTVITLDEAPDILPCFDEDADHSGQISVFIQNTFCLFFISSPIYHNDSPLFRFTSGIFRCTREQTSVSCRRC